MSASSSVEEGISQAVELGYADDAEIVSLPRCDKHLVWGVCARCVVEAGKVGMGYDGGPGFPGLMPGAWQR